MYSKEHLKYLKSIKKHNFIIRTIQILILVLFVLLWQFLADLKLINVFISSSPKLVLKTLIELYKGDLFSHVFTIFSGKLFFEISD